MQEQRAGERAPLRAAAARGRATSSVGAGKTSRYGMPAIVHHGRERGVAEPVRSLARFEEDRGGHAGARCGCDADARPRIRRERRQSGKDQRGKPWPQMRAASC